MQTRVLQDWKPMRWLPFIETRTLGVFLTTNPTIHYDMLPLITEWRFRRFRHD